MKLDLSKDFDKKKGILYFKKLLDGGNQIELRKIMKSKTVSQNAYLHVCIGIFSMETGHTLEEGKQLLKLMCPMMNYKKTIQFEGIVIEGNEEEVTVLKSVADLNTEQIGGFITWIRNFASRELGIYIPTSEEYLANKFNIDRDLQKVITHS